ncbi:MAG: hypothetical protein JWO41_2 [Candidatus Saccharibacteria bacterium]|nr:hypothetical protein [Candidatus Saccharibacteria bacterium]
MQLTVLTQGVVGAGVGVAAGVFGEDDAGFFTAGAVETVDGGVLCVDVVVAGVAVGAALEAV